MDEWTVRGRPSTSEALRDRKTRNISLRKSLSMTPTTQVLKLSHFDVVKIKPLSETIFYTFGKTLFRLEHQTVRKYLTGISKPNNSGIVVDELPQFCAV